VKSTRDTIRKDSVFGLCELRGLSQLV
jgi:hypothetical protein